MAFSPKYTVTAQMLANLAKIEVIKQQFENQPIYLLQYLLAVLWYNYMWQQFNTLFIFWLYITPHIRDYFTKIL